LYLPYGELLKEKNKYLWLFIIIFALILSILLAGVISDRLFQPVIRLFWLLKNFYMSINQTFLWGLVLIGVAVIAGLSLHIESNHPSIPQIRRKKRAGEVGQLAFWIRGAKHRYFARWYMARNLAELTIKILLEQGADDEHAKQFQGPGWKPPEKIQSYLKTAMDTTAVTFRNHKKTRTIHPDPEIISIIDYIESYVETAND
jgi:hypothetical protein